jgi:hypothetical protein
MTLDNQRQAYTFYQINLRDTSGLRKGALSETISRFYKWRLKLDKKHPEH